MSYFGIHATLKSSYIDIMGDLFSSSSRFPPRVISPMSVEEFLHSVARIPTPRRFEKRRQRGPQLSCISTNVRMDYANGNTFSGNHSSPDMFDLECVIEELDEEVQIPKKKTRRQSRIHQENGGSPTSRPMETHVKKKSYTSRRIPVDELVLITDRHISPAGSEHDCEFINLKPKESFLSTLSI